MAEAKEALQQAEDSREIAQQLATEANREAATWADIRSENGMAKAVRELFGS